MEFNYQQLESALQSLQTPSAVADLNFSVHVFESIPSTNRSVWELLDQGATSGTVAIALEQMAGKGQWGRQWQSARGGLYLSLALALDLPIENAAQLTLCSAWGIATALRHEGIPVMLKWPNDLVLHGRKLGGILTETRVHRSKITKAVVGVGINWANPVPEIGINLHSWLEDQAKTGELAQSRINSLETLAAVTLWGIATGYHSWQHEGIENSLSAYWKLLSHAGHSVLVEGRRGTIVGVSPQGNLRVRFDPDPAEFSQNLILEADIQPGTISLGYD